MKHKLCLVFLVLLSLLLYGCEQKDYTLHFSETMILQYGADKNTIDLIDKIGDVEVTDDMKKDNFLAYKTLVVECDRVDTSVLTDYEVTYKTNRSDNRLITKTVKIRDTTPPVITFKGLTENKTLSIKKEEFKNYNFNKNIDVKDNYDQKPQTEVKIEDKKNNQYSVKVTATDKFGNVSSDTFSMVFIKESENKKEPDSSTNQETQSSTKSHNQSGTQNNSNSKQTKKTDESVKEQIFYFGSVYNGIECNIDNVTSICFSQLSKSGKSGSCIPLKDENGIYIGMRLIFG